MAKRKLKSLTMDISMEDPPVNRLVLVWADGQEETLDFETQRELMKKYLEVKDLLPDPKRGGG